MRKIKILLQGYIGYKNFGDDLLFEMAIKKIEKIPNTEIYVAITNLKLDPSYLNKYCSNLNILKFNGRLPLLFFNKFDKVYYIGGGIFFDYKKEVSNISFLKNYISNIIRYKIPKLLGTDFGGIGIGIGPYYSGRANKLHSQMIKSLTLLGVRDETSFLLAKSMGIKDLYLSNDLSLGLYSEVKNLQPEHDKSKEIIICPRSYTHNRDFEKHIDILVEFSSYIQEKGFIAHWVFLQEDDKDLTQKIIDKFKITVWNPFEMSIIDFIRIFKGAKVTFTSRMHTVFVAGMAQTPFVAIPVHPKLEYAAQLFYNNPILIDPLDNIEVYIDAFYKTEENDLMFEKLLKEKAKMDDLNLSLNQWISC